jgi:hypothetical protein
MKSMYAAFAAIVVITVAAWFTLNELGMSSGERATGPAVRLGDGEG